MHLLAKTTLLALALSGPIQAQTPILTGYWDDKELGANPPVTVELYVDGIQTGVTPDGTVCAPYPTITAALNAWSTDPVASSVPTTINVAALTYVENLKLPAHGLALEVWRRPQAFSSARPRLVAASAAFPILEVNAEGDASLPHTQIRGFHFDSSEEVPFPIAIDITAPGPVESPLAVEITQCLFEQVAAGVRIYSSVERARSEHMIHNNVFEVSLSEGAQGGIGILDLSAKKSANVIRSNQITNFNVGILADSNEFSPAHPFVCSNFIQQCDFGVLTGNSNMVLTNNTIAFCNQFGVAQGIGSMTVHNNIFWSPQSVFTNAIDYSASGGTFNQGNNLLSGPGSSFASFFPAGTVPSFSDPDYPTLPLTAPADLHLAGVFVGGVMTNPMFGAGDNAYVTGPVLGPNGITRIDINVDIDHDPRQLDHTQIGSPSVDVGADEVSRIDIGEHNIRFAPVPTTPPGSGSWDVYGNVNPDLSGVSPEYYVDVLVTGPAGGIALVTFGTIYRESLLIGAQLVANTHLFQQILSPWGTVLFDLTPSWHTLAAPAVSLSNPGGIATVRLPFGTRKAADLESEFVIQALIAAPNGGPMQLTNKLVVELNDICGTGF